MADAPKILKGESLRQTYPKLNAAIDNANEALKKSTTAETNSVIAVNKADSVQQQFNQVVIEGDSSVESAQARVAEDGTTFSTLKERLDSSDTQVTAAAKKIERHYLNLRDYGADPTGTDYSDAAFSEAVLDAQAKKTPLLIDGVFKFTGTLEIPSDVMLIGAPEAVLDGSELPTGTTYGDSYLLKIQGLKETGMALSLDVARFSRTIDVADSSSFSKGDLIYIQSTDKYDPSATSVVEKSDLVKVEKVVGSTIHIEGSLFWSYAAATALIHRIVPAKNISLENIHIRMGEGKAQAGIHCEFAENLNIKECTIEKGEDAGIYLTRCYNTKVLHSNIFDCVTPSTFTAGYGIAVGAATRHLLIDGNHFWNNRHSVTGGGGAGGFVQVVNNSCTGDSDNSLDMHEPCFNWQFFGNKIQGSFGGIIARGQDVLIANNEIVDATESAIIIKAFSYEITEAHSYNISGNRVRGAKYGITMDGLRGRLKNIVVSGNVFEGCSNEGIYGAKLDQISITGNTVRDYGRGMRLQECEGITISGNAFHYGGGATITGTGDAISLYNCGVFTATGNSFKDGGQHLKIEYCGKGYTIEGNAFQNAGVYGIMLGQSSPNGVVLGNTFRDMDTASSKSIRTFVGNLIISNNLFLSNAGEAIDIHFTNGSNIVLTGNIMQGYYTDSAITNLVLANNITTDIA